MNNVINKTPIGTNIPVSNTSIKNIGQHNNLSALSFILHNLGNQKQQ